MLFVYSRPGLVRNNKLDPETIELIPSLLRLHDLGILTVSSQPAQDGYSKIGSEWWQCHQIPYLTFILPFTGPSTIQFCEDLLKDKDLITRVLDYDKDYLRVFPGSYMDEFVVSRDRSAASREQLDTKPWRDVTSLPDMNNGRLQAVDILEGLFLKKTGFRGHIFLVEVISVGNIDLLIRIEEHVKHYGTTFSQPQYIDGLDCYTDDCKTFWSYRM